MSKNYLYRFKCKLSDLVIFSPQLGISKNYAKWCQYFILLFRRFVDVLENIKSFRQIRPKTTERRTNIGVTRRNSDGRSNGSSLEDDSTGGRKKKSSFCCCGKPGTDRYRFMLDAFSFSKNLIQWREQINIPYLFGNYLKNSITALLRCVIFSQSNPISIILML